MNQFKFRLIIYARCFSIFCMFFTVCLFSANSQMESIEKHIIEQLADELVWDVAGFKNSQFSYLSLSSFYKKLSHIDFTHQFKLNAVVFRNSGWTKNILFTHIENMALIYSQCGLKVSNITLIDVDDIPFIIDDDSTLKDELIDIAKLIPIKERPIAFFVESLVSNIFGIAYNPYNIQIDSEDEILKNLLFISKKSQDPLVITSRDEGYNIFAHELGHLFCDCGHKSGLDANIMSYKPSFRSDVLTSTQCEYMKRSNVITEIKK